MTDKNNGKVIKKITKEIPQKKSLLQSMNKMNKTNITVNSTDNVINELNNVNNELNNDIELMFQEITNDINHLTEIKSIKENINKFQEINNKISNIRTILNEYTIKLSASEMTNDELTDNTFIDSLKDLEMIRTKLLNEELSLENFMNLYLIAKNKINNCDTYIAKQEIDIIEV